MAEEMNPDLMEYQMDIDDRTITSPHTMSQPTCPYRPTADTSNALAAFQSGWPHNPHLDPSGPSFGSSSNPGGVYWGGMPSHSSPHLDPTAGGPSHQLSHPGRPGSAARYSLTPFNHSPGFASNQQRFLHPEDNRHAMPRMPDMDRFHNSHENRQGESQNAGPMPSVATGVPNYGSSDEAAQRRTEFMQAQMARSQQEAQSNRNPRQPPTLTVQSTFFPTHLPQPNFTSNRSPSHFQGIQGSRDTFLYSSRNMPGPPPAQPPRQMSQFEQEQRRAWIHEANLASDDYGDDSDDDSLDSFNTRLDQRERDLGLPPSQTRHAPAAAHGQRRPAMSSSEGEERELAMERSRAARRAAVAAAKLVASPAALASLEKVELSSLSGDDRSCIICYNEFGIKNPDGNIECAVRLPKCKHVFGDHCLKHWLKDSDSCPYCRDKLPSEPKKSHAEEMRRLFVLNRPATSSAHHHGGPITPEERAAAYAAMDHRQLGQAYLERVQVQSQLHALYAIEAQSRARVENAALEQSEMIMRHSMQRQEEWAAMQQHASAHAAARAMPDHESRRRNRQRANSIRNSNSNSNSNNSNNGSGSSTARFSSPATHRVGHNPGSGSSPNPASGPGANANSNATLRVPTITNRNIFDTANTVAAVLGQPRSVTPHPSVLESGGSATAAPAPASASARRASLNAAAEAPVRTPARDAARHEILGLPPLQAVEQTPSPPASLRGGDEVVMAAAEARVQSAVWGAGRPVSESFLGVGGGGGGFQAGVMDGGGARRWGGRG
ncbi:hypothetical protein VE03_07620 [Pseudogymnoascus sp. 23342-1-I1]|nr:hypothetical protein VE03_07620 [Pseudogymnoascus sp. 23342-1-I1]